MEDYVPVKQDEYTSIDPTEYVSANSIGSFPESIQKKQLPLRGEEKALAELSPSAYGVLGATLELIPYMRYALPSNRDEWSQLDKQDQINALLTEELGAVLWIWGGKVLKDVGYMAKQGIKPVGWFAKKLGKATKVPKVLPYEDAVKGVNAILGEGKYKPFSYGEVVKGKLKGKGFAAEEAEAISAVLQGEDEGRLLDVVLERKYKGRDSTKAFEGAVKWQSGRLYPRPSLRKSIMDEYAEEAVRTKFYSKQFEKVLYEDVYRSKPTKRTSKFIFEAHAKRMFPDRPNISFSDVTPHQMTNIMLDMLENKAVTRAIASPTKLATFHPARVVFGAGEQYMKTKSFIYEPIKAALQRTNRNYFNHSLLWAKMLEQRGAYTKVIIKESGEFVAKKAKWLTPEVQDEAFKVLRGLDDLQAQLARVGSKEEQMAILDQMAGLAGDVSNGAKVLIDTFRTYSDHLYGEHMKMQLPRVFRKAGLTELGQAKIDEMLTGPQGLLYEVDRLFSTVSSKNPTEKIVGAKEILKKARARLDYVGETHPYFKAEGKDLEKVLKEANQALNWGGGRKSFMKYLENYTSRVSQHEDAMLMKWREGMFQGQQAFHTKIRKLEKMRGEPVDFGTMLQARTMSHAKEHFLYDTLDKVIDFTIQLPPQWVRYVDHYVGGILNVPTVWDYMASRFLEQSVGRLERMMGREGLWSEQRVTNLAYTINNMTYLGGLGFKPFSAARNLFQPLLTVPADMGGLKDLGRLVSGYKWALNPKNRAYIRSLGAISEYAPEVHLRPAMLTKGKKLFGKELPTMEQVRDAGMWMFKGSDRFNRYVTGGAANLKWDALVKKFGLPKTAKEVKFFSRKMGISRRQEWMRAEIEDLLHRGKFAEAKGAWIRDVIADTQYLYGVAEAPTIIRRFGGVGRTATIFQSWWMNYGSLLTKWATTGEIDAKASRLFVGMVSQSLAYMLMEPIWGKNVATKSTFLGAFPKEFNEFLLPPSWAPVYHMAAAVSNIQSPEVSSRHAKAVLDSSWIFVPAGLQLKKFIKSTREEGWTGFNKAILNLPKKP